MTVFVLAAATARPERAKALAAQPEFRRASRGMTFCADVMDQLLMREPKLVERIGSARVGMLIGTSQGELEVTKDFLMASELQGVARPLLFQNSLHNSTLGFLTLRYKIEGVAMTLSHGMVSGEDSIDSAKFLLEQNKCDLCFAIGYDLLVEGLEEVRSRFYPAGLLRGEGAAGLMLANDNAARMLRECSPLAELRDLKITRGLKQLSRDEVRKSFDGLYYDADGVSHVAHRLSQPDSEEKIFLPKPDGSSAMIELKRL